MPRFVTRTARGAPRRAARAVQIVVVAGPDIGASLPLRRGSAVVGTLEGCDLKLTDPSVSRQHLRLELRSDGLCAVDLKSRNGTFFDGARIHEAAIPLGARLRIGDTDLRVEPLGSEQPTPGPHTEFFGLSGSSSAMREVISLLEKVSASDATLLLEGESGTGKEVAARAVHAASGRKGAFVVFDCGAHSEETMASALFGHEKGAFTGAERTRVGAAQQAQQGTLFVDEVGELDLPLQPLLLRLLDAKEVFPLGASQAQKVDVRVVAATNRDLNRDVHEGRFREDLLFRLSVITVRLPPLRERLDDVPALAQRILEAAGVELELNDATLDVLRSYSWPGNVRELRNALLRAAALGVAPNLASSERPAATPSGGRVPAGGVEIPVEYRQARESMMARFEREYLLNLLATAGRNVSQAARLAGVARGHLYRLLKKHELV